MKSKKVRGNLTLFSMFKYAVGEGVVSITLNGMNNFAMIYLTQILNLSASWAALSISISIIWDAVTDPIMGHISDNTRTRWGRRHPFMLIGGILSTICYILFWTLPQIPSTPWVVFSAAMGINLMIRTALTVYAVPYTALGFEICSDYEDRARLQGVRFFISQITNFIFGALAWSLFFQERIVSGGEIIDGSLISKNYWHMAIVFSFFMFILVLICCWGTRRFATDNRSELVHNNSIRAFRENFSSILKDRLAIQVFIFFIVAQLAMMLVGQTQMFTYIFYMKFSALEKTFVHGGGMLAFAFCALNLFRVVKRFDKKPAGFIGIGLSLFGGLGLLAVFTGGLMVPGQIPFLIFGKPFSVATLVFGFLQMCWWGGNGMIVPVATSMVADVAAINERKTGVAKNASYASIFSFLTKASGSIGMIISGLILTFSGIVSGSAEQTPEAIRKIAILTFSCGPIVVFISALLLFKYPVNRLFMAQAEK